MSLIRIVRRYGFLIAVAVLAVGFVYQAAIGPEEPQTAAVEPAEPSRAPMPDAEPQAPRRAAHAYLTAFLDDSLTDMEWRVQTLTHATADMSAVLTMTPRAVTPNATVERVEVTDTTPGEALAVARLSDGSTAEMRVVIVNGVWRVDEVEIQ